MSLIELDKVEKQNEFRDSHWWLKFHIYVIEKGPCLPWKKPSHPGVTWLRFLTGKPEVWNCEWLNYNTNCILLCRVFSVKARTLGKNRFLKIAIVMYEQILMKLATLNPHILTSLHCQGGYLALNESATAAPCKALWISLRTYSCHTSCFYTYNYSRVHTIPHEWGANWPA